MKITHREKAKQRICTDNNQIVVWQIVVIWLKPIATRCVVMMKVGRVGVNARYHS